MRPQSGSLWAYQTFCQYGIHSKGTPMTDPHGTSADIAPVDAIRVGERDRTELGDIAELADSIKAVGLLHPIVVTDSLDLVAGGRRLAAIRELGWTEVPVTVVDLDSAADVLRAELEENTCRKRLSPIEASHARERRAKALAPQAAERKAHGKTAPGRTAAQVSPAIWDEPGADASANLAEASKPPTAAETRKVAAIGTGFSGSSIDKVDDVRRIAEQGVTTIGTGRERREVEVPEPVREIARRKVAELAKTGAAVQPAHREVRQAMEEYLADDPELTRLTLRRNFLAAQSKAADITSFDPERVALALEKDAEWDQLDRLQGQINEWFGKLKAARPRGLRVVGGSE